MQLQECYEIFGGSYQDVKSRLLKDTLIERLVIKFLSDTSYETLSQAMEKKDYGEAFRAVHTLKGICQNLSFDCLSRSTHEMTEVLRSWESESADEEKLEQLWQQVSLDYALVTNSIMRLKESDTSNE